jgi:hypothetical protein
METLVNYVEALTADPLNNKLRLDYANHIEGSCPEGATTLRDHVHLMTKIQPKYHKNTFKLTTKSYAQMDREEAELIKKLDSHVIPTYLAFPIFLLDKHTAGFCKKDSKLGIVACLYFPTYNDAMTALSLALLDVFQTL